MGNSEDCKSSAPFPQESEALRLEFISREVRSGPLVDAGLHPVTQSERDARPRTPHTLSSPRRWKPKPVPCPKRGPFRPWRPSPPGRVTKTLDKWGRVSGAGHWDRTPSGGRGGLLSFPAQTRDIRGCAATGRRGTFRSAFR